MAVLEIVLPGSFVASSINMGVYSYAVSFIIDPVSFIDVSINMGELSPSMGAIVLPKAFVLSAISPSLLALAISKSSFPLTFISGSARLEFVQRSLFSGSVGIVNFFSYGLFLFSHGKVSAVCSLGVSHLCYLASSDVTTPQCLHLNNFSGVVSELVKTIFTCAHCSFSAQTLSEI